MSIRYMARPASGILTASGAQAANSSGLTEDSSGRPNPNISKAAPAIDKGAPTAIAKVFAAVPKTIPTPSRMQTHAAITRFNFRLETGFGMVIDSIRSSS